MVAEVEHGSIQRFADVIGQIGMAGVNQFHSSFNAVFAQQSGGVGQGLRLDVERPNFSVPARKLRQKQGVAAVSGCAVQGAAAVFQTAFDELPGKGKGGQQGHIRFSGCRFPLFVWPVRRTAESKARAV